MTSRQKIPASRFESFHRHFQGDNPSIFKICADCGGKCEYSKIATLLPGEAEYMASVLGIAINKFRDRFLDRLHIDDESFDVLKLVDPCPFLEDNYECNCRKCKVVLCEIYPIVFEICRGEVKYLLDEWCPLTKQPKYEAYFRNTGIAALKDLDIPPDWLEFVAQYDGLYFDYSKLQKHRASLEIPIDICGTFTLDTLLSFKLNSTEVVGRYQDTTDS